MEILEVFFPVSGVETNVLLPPLVMLVISFFSSLGGLSGAFLLLPFQMSVLGFTSPAVTATNFVYNIVAIPGGLGRYMKEGRMNWSLAAVISASTIPGVFFGYFLRVRYLPEPGKFKVFVGVVLLYIALRMLRDILRPPAEGRDAGNGFTEGSKVRTAGVSLRYIEYDFDGKRYSFRPVPLFILSFFVGVVGGAYGIGGGAIIAPFCISVFGLPVYTVAGASLLGTLLTSVVGAGFYSLVPSALDTSPDWALGVLFGLGGLVGIYLGARAQKYVPQKFIKILLAVVLLLLGTRYIYGYLF